jgi:glycosyltransferase involved in cell wall biosynthesis
MESQLPEISVITPVLNCGRFIEDAIRSVLRQGYPRFEHVVVDGGSTDGTLEILKRYPHLTWTSERDGGQSDAMNKGFDLATGDVVVYLNADDYFAPAAFRAVIPYFQAGASFVVGRINMLYEDGSVVVNDPKTEFGDMLRWWEPNAYPCNPVGYFYLRDVQEAVGGFNVDSPIAMDLEFLLEASRRYRFTKIRDIIGTFRLFPGTKTFDTASQESEILSTICDPYLEHFGGAYVKRYLQDRQARSRDAASAGHTRPSLQAVTEALRRKVRKATYDLFERTQ